MTNAYYSFNKKGAMDFATNADTNIWKRRRKGNIFAAKQPESKAEAAAITSGFASPSNYIFNKLHGLDAL